MVVSATSAACLLAGLGLACASLRRPERAEILELWSGVCLLAGLVLLGASLQLAR